MHLPLPFLFARYYVQNINHTKAFGCLSDYLNFYCVYFLVKQCRAFLIANLFSTNLALHSMKSSFVSKKSGKSPIVFDAKKTEFLFIVSRMIVVCFVLLMFMCFQMLMRSSVRILILYTTLCEDIKADMTIRFLVMIFGYHKFF